MDPTPSPGSLREPPSPREARGEGKTVPLGKRHLRKAAMKSLRLLVVVAAFGSLTGCESLKKIMNRDPEPKAAGPLPPVQPDQLVTYLNERSARLQSLYYGDVRVTARGQGVLVPVTLTGRLAASQPRNFRMSVTGKLAGKVDLGSNPDQFWVYFDGAGPRPMYVYASHADFENGKARLPGDLPFEPDWVMQALGMTTFPPPDTQQGLPPGTPTTHYTALPPDQKNRTYTLSWPSTTPNGASIVKEVVFDGDPATGTKPQVKMHLIRDTKGKVICSAEIKRAETVQLPQTDSRTGLPLAIQHPTLVVLKWEEQKVEMELELKNARVNEPFSPDDARHYFNKPTNLGVAPIDLAQYNAPIK